jgi:hypothetical protein
MRQASRLKSCPLICLRIRSIVGCLSKRKPRRSLRRELEHHAAIRAARGRGAVEISLVVNDQVSIGLGSVRADEGVQHSVRPLAFGIGSQPVDHAATAAGTAINRRALEVSSCP